jgi:hypothetical protein
MTTRKTRTYCRISSIFPFPPVYARVGAHTHAPEGNMENGEKVHFCEKRGFW